MKKFSLIGFALLALAANASAQTAITLPFETHAAFFSKEIHQPRALDPQVFVLDPDASAGVGPQQIAHVAGVRNARVDDDPSLPIYTAQRESIGITLGQWLGAHGTVTLTPLSQGHERVTVKLMGLTPNAQYSLFENHFDQTPIGFSPLDGNARHNSFRADSSGAATVSVVAPSMLTHANAVLVVYHSDGKTHGQERGQIGVNAHHQLIAQVPDGAQP